LIASWPEKIVSGKVCRDLVDMTDFLPTICDAAGVPLPEHSKLDGRSFLPQLRGQIGNPRDWIYSYWVPLRANQTAHVGSRGEVEQAFDRRFKRYSTGDFFDLQTDVEEKSPQCVNDLSGEASTAAQRLQDAINHFKDARPDDLDPPKVPGERGKVRKKNR
jgi:arylsulfatase A